MAKRILKKTAAVGGATVLAMSLMACSNPSSNATTTGGLVPMNSSQRNECSKWEQKKDGSEECKDTSSSRSGMHYFNGAYYGNQAAMIASSNYQSNNLVSGTTRSSSASKSNTSSPSKTSTTSSKSGNTGKSGLGSGGGSRGGSGLS